MFPRLYLFRSFCDFGGCISASLILQRRNIEGWMLPGPAGPLESDEPCCMRLDNTAAISASEGKTPAPLFGSPCATIGLHSGEVVARMQFQGDLVAESC